jgi:hypothetical protein
LSRHFSSRSSDEAVIRLRSIKQMDLVLINLKKKISNRADQSPKRGKILLPRLASLRPPLTSPRLASCQHFKSLPRLASTRAVTASLRLASENCEDHDRVPDFRF